jgi:hypothetical protein
MSESGELARMRMLYEGAAEERDNMIDDVERMRSDRDAALDKVAELEAENKRRARRVEGQGGGPCA